MNRGISAMLRSYQRASVAATRGLTRNWIIIPASVAAFLAYSVLAALVSPLGFAGGFILGFAGLYLITLYYSWILETAEQRRLEWRELLEFDRALFSRLISVAFIIYLAQFVVSAFAQSVQQQEILLFFSLGVFFLFNPVAEFASRGEQEGLAALRSAFEFSRDNLVVWFLPFLLLLLPTMAFDPSGTVALKLFASGDILLPSAPVFAALQSSLASQGLPELLAAAVGVSAAVWFGVFRIKLFAELT